MSEWIDVTESLPGTANRLYWVAVKPRSEWPDHLRKDNLPMEEPTIPVSFANEIYTRTWAGSIITHWMPRVEGEETPAPPKQREGETFHRLMHVIGYTSQYMMQDEHYMIFPRDKAEREKYGTAHFSPRAVKALEKLIISLGQGAEG